MTTLIDTNTVIALLEPDDHFHQWAVEKIQERREEGPTVISDIIYCESSVALQKQEEMDEAIGRLGLDRLPSYDAALFQAGKIFKIYKEKNKGPKTGVLPDFLIGALAASLEIPLMTTNPKDFTGYFPGLVLIKPEKVASD